MKKVKLGDFYLLFFLSLVEFTLKRENIIIGEDKCTN